MKAALLTSLVIFLTLPNFAFAQPLQNWKFSVGPGLVLKNNLRQDNQYSNSDRNINYRFIPFIDGRYNRLSLGQNGLSLRVVGNFVMHANLFVNIGGDKYKSQGMDTRYASAFAGLNLKFFSHQLVIARDVQSRSQGMEVKYSYSKMNMLSDKWILINTIGLSYYDNKYANYYYGVRTHEATSQRKAYHASGYIVPSVGVLPIYKFSENISGTIGLFFKYIPQKITASPLMNGKQLETSTVWGLSYNL